VIGRLDEVVIDCHDPAKLSEFWLAVLGGRVVRQSHEWVALHPPHGVTVSFQEVPEPKMVKNRVHLDVVVADLEVATEAAEALGATRLGEIRWDELGGFQVMADPEGNEFCLILGATPIA
jgi:catechol 2,3-dioxygenase-like lactoylglutathione lyase family enzyme